MTPSASARTTQGRSRCPAPTHGSIGREPAWLIDPGPALREHLDAISEELDERGGLGAVLLTHDHPDHAEAVPELILRFSPAPLAAARGAVTTLLRDGDRYGPFEVVATPGHAPDHLTFLTEDGLAFTGDAVLGEGSVFVLGQLGEYLDGLRRLRGRRAVADRARAWPGCRRRGREARASTSLIAWPGRRLWLPRLPKASAQLTIFSMRCGRTRPPNCAAPRRSRSRPTCRSSKPRGGYPTA